MATKTSNLSPEKDLLDVEKIGTFEDAKLTAGQERNLEGAGIPLTVGDIYVIVPQYTIPMLNPRATSDANRWSKRFMAGHFDKEGNLVDVRSIKYSSLRQRHYGTTDNDAPQIRSTVNDSGFMRMNTDDAEGKSISCVSGRLPMKSSDKHVARMIDPVALVYTGSTRAYVPQFKTRENGYDMVVKDGKIDFTTQDVLNFGITAHTPEMVRATVEAIKSLGDKQASFLITKVED